MPQPTDNRLALLLRSLPPAPAAWVDAAREVPRIQRDLEEVLPRIAADAGLRAETDADLERAMEAAGVEPRPSLLAAVRRRLEEMEA